MNDRQELVLFINGDKWRTDEQMESTSQQKYWKQPGWYTHKYTTQYNMSRNNNLKEQTPHSSLFYFHLSLERKKKRHNNYIQEWFFFLVDLKQEQEDRHNASIKISSGVKKQRLEGSCLSLCDHGDVYNNNNNLNLDFTLGCPNSLTIDSNSELPLLKC